MITPCRTLCFQHQPLLNSLIAHLFRITSPTLLVVLAEEPPGPPNPSSNGVPTNESRPYVGARMDKMDGGNPGHTFPGVSQNDSVKRHLDVYQVEASLNEVYILERRRLIGY
jgi:hypothetical protein